MIVKRQRTVYVYEKDRLYDWCSEVTHKATNLKNAVRFRQRQVFTARNKKVEELSQNEQSVLDEIKATLGYDLTKRKKSLSYSSLYRLMYDSHNPDYFAEGLPVQTAQHVIKQCCYEFRSWFEAIKAWKENPSAFTGKPELPSYARKGGMIAATITNQDCKLKTDANGMTWAYFVYTKKLPLCIGMPEGRLKEVKLIPAHGCFKLSFVFDVEVPDVVLKEVPVRVAAVDFGVDNLMAVTNNIGAKCLLYKGGIVKSVNRFYNKEISKIMSEEMTKPDCPKNKDGNPRFVPTDRYHQLTLERNNRIHDFMLKTACHFIAWCVEHRIDTIVLGVNKGWKDEVSMGRFQNQSFVKIPFSYLQNVIAYKAEAHGIAVIRQEESYTSKASFLDDDPIPVYKKGDNTKYTFSGRRRPTKYGDMYKKDGFRGLYESKDGTVINSDLNGSANILRKALSDAFKNGTRPDFGAVRIVKNPEMTSVLANQRKQASEQRNTVMSKSKAKRFRKKCSA